MSFKIFIFLMIIVSKSCVSQDYASIDDIPIENYDHGDHQENHMDLELLPRHGRSFSLDDDPKDLFFRSMRSFDEVDDVPNFGPYQYLPRPSFEINDQKDDSRNKRSATEPSYTEEKILSGIVDQLGKPLEVIPWDAKNLTDSEDKSTTRMAFEDPKNDKDLSINDFIRFRRSANKNVNEKDVTSNSNGNGNPFAEKLIMASSNEDINREARGAIKEHWIKQLYPVSRSDDLYLEDNVPSSSETVKTPRVHFVGKVQSKGESTPNEFRSYEREGRSRPLEREPPPREANRGLGGELERNIPFYDRRFRPHMPPPERERLYYRDELYPRYDYRDPRNMYFSRYENYDRTRNEHSLSPYKPQKRIIYYATLPEVSRNPPNLDSRDRYRYQADRFDDRYLSDPYRFRQTYPKSRYEEEGKTPYPVKVLTDVNVREVKKNPERRIYSEVDRSRYAYNTPAYRAVDG